MSQQQARRRARGGWSEQENQLLWDAVRNAEGTNRPLKDVFQEVANATGRQPNSIRNYYYTVARARGEGSWRTLSFVPFQEQETRKLIKEILVAMAKGESVRACVQRLAGQDRSLMLRYQNKYRAVLKSRPDLVMETLEEIRREGIAATNPYDRMERRKNRREAGTEHDGENMSVSFASLGPDAAPMVRGLRKLLARADHQVELNRTLREENDRLKVQVDLLRIELAKRDESSK